MLVCVNRRATAEALIVESGAFAINVLTEDQHQIARLFSTSKLGADERFADGKWVSMVLDGAARHSTVRSLRGSLAVRIISISGASLRQPRSTSMHCLIGTACSGSLQRDPEAKSARSSGNAARNNA
jgi:hypothetical protein